MHDHPITVTPDDVIRNLDATGALHWQLGIARATIEAMAHELEHARDRIVELEALEVDSPRDEGAMN